MSAKLAKTVYVHTSSIAATKREAALISQEIVKRNLVSSAASPTVLHHPDHRSVRYGLQGPEYYCLVHECLAFAAEDFGD